MATSHDLAELRGLALATLFPGFEGTSAPPSWLVRLAAEGLGGVVLFGRNIDPARGDAGVAGLAAALHAAAPGLLIGIDEEGGDVTRLDVAQGSSVPGNAALGALDDVDATEAVAAELGARLRACGIDLNFAPVADVDLNPHNPVIGVRAFGFDPELVARHVGAFVAGQQSQRVVAAAKHFPGHGATSEDSHLTVPVLDESLDVLRRRELAPFRAAVKADVKIVMTAHIRVTALDADDPGTLSPAVVTGLLREELGYDGVVMTDGLDMHAISQTVGHAEAGVRALLAGVDALCVGGESTDAGVVEGMAAAIVEAVVAGRLPYARLAEAARRVRGLRAWVDEPVVAGLRDGAARQAAGRAVSAHGRVAVDGSPLVVEFHDDPSLAAGYVPWGVGGPLAARMPDAVVVRLTEDGPAIGDVLAEHAGRPLVVAVRGVRRRPWQAAALEAARALRPDLVVVDHDVASEPEVLGDHYVLAHGAARVTAEAAAELIAADGAAARGATSAEAAR
ncbi:MAG TPA: glycoside hydrolase family 3 N-terminal domain-containing protein [Jiangellaceae bacterium]